MENWDIYIQHTHNYMNNLNTSMISRFHYIALSNDCYVANYKHTIDKFKHIVMYVVIRIYVHSCITGANNILLLSNNLE